MTREELKENICGMTYDDMFEYIYNLETRTCENCKHYNREYIGYCDNTGSLSTYHQITETTFGCNKFEHKLESK